MEYPKASKYSDLEKAYAEGSSPGCLELAEFVAHRMGLQSGTRLLDIGIFHGYQTCFLAKEYGAFVVAADPWQDRDGAPFVDHLYQNACEWQAADRVPGVRVGVPDLKLADASFDAVYSTTTLEMIRGFRGEAGYRECLSEVLRVLRPGGLVPATGTRCTWMRTFPETCSRCTRQGARAGRAALPP